MVREILPSTDKRLRLKSKPISTIDKKILSLVRDLKETLAVQKDPEGIGLAAPQIGKNLRVFVMKPDKKIKAIINPKILNISKVKVDPKEKQAKKIMEGCLSLPHFYGPIRRAQKVKVIYLDEVGRQKVETFEGIEAQIVQHEIDHLEGILFVDRLLEQKKPLYEYVDGEWERVEL